MMRLVMYFGLAGFLVPAILMVLSTVDPLRRRVLWWLLWGFYVWPSAILLGATYEHELTALGIFVLALSIAMNMLLYSAVGAVAWLLFARFFK
jgi:hypothetical protein